LFSFVVVAVFLFWQLPQFSIFEFFNWPSGQRQPNEIAK